MINDYIYDSGYVAGIEYVIDRLHKVHNSLEEFGMSDDEANLLADLMIVFKDHLGELQ